MHRKESFYLHRASKLFLSEGNFGFSLKCLIECKKIHGIESSNNYGWPMLQKVLLQKIIQQSQESLQY